MIGRWQGSLLDLVFGIPSLGQWDSGTDEVTVHYGDSQGELTLNFGDVPGCGATAVCPVIGMH